MDEPTVVYTDGACLGNPGPGGWAWAIPGGNHDSGGEDHTTNQRMEVTAVLEAIQSIKGDIEIYSDSKYVVSCFNDLWYEGWIARGWKTSARKDVANQDLWMPLIDLYRERGGSSSIKFNWVKGHSGNEHNDRVDMLAVAAAELHR